MLFRSMVKRPNGNNENDKISRVVAFFKSMRFFAPAFFAKTFISLSLDRLILGKPNISADNSNYTTRMDFSYSFSMVKQNFYFIPKNSALHLCNSLIGGRYCMGFHICAVAQNPSNLSIARRILYFLCTFHRKCLCNSAFLCIMIYNYQSIFETGASFMKVREIRDILSAEIICGEIGRAHV